jgi:acyl dehydratase
MEVAGLDKCVSRVQSTLYSAAIRFAHQVHFDDELCRAQGWKGTILPGFLLGNWCLEAVTRMLGPRSVVRSVNFRLTSVAYPDTKLRVSGEVTDVEHGDEWTLVTCAMRVIDPDDTLVTKATVTVGVPTIG